ncbi:MAG: hypothetical protein HKP08_00300, partial [Flavobacteriaceae bacterium]|nr:hypothetical protein [Flavobacteriaceae bacterium]
MKTTNHKALRSLLSYFIIVVGLLGCSNTTSITDPLNRALNSEDVRIRKVMDDPSPFEVQIRFTRISREKDSVYFEDYDYNVDSTLYFYPASTVKFPISLLALEKINRNKDLSINTRFYVEGDSLETTFAEEITKIFAVSDNDANNRLLEFLGQDAINASFKEKK